MNEALFAHAVRLHQAGNLAEAAKLYSAVLQTAPRNYHALYLLGFVHFQQRRFADAARLIGEAVRINPGAPDAFYNLGCALQPLNRHGEAVAAFDRAIALKPDYAEAMINRGVALMALKRQADAVGSFDRALTLTPRDTEALSNRATALFELKRYADAADGYARLLAIAPDFPNVPGNVALARAYACDWTHFEDDQTRIRTALAAGRSAISPHGSTLILDDPAAQLACAKRWVADRCPPTAMPLWRGEIYRHEKVRVAYVSADFHAHATAFLIAGVLEQHDRNRFDISLISFSPDDQSDMRARLLRNGRFVDVSGKSDLEAATLMRQIEIDIAVDLKGFTEGSRPGIFAYRPAPLQVNYLAHPGTMGAPYMDYIVADRIIIPPEHRSFYTENIVDLPDCYQANDDKRVVPEKVPTRAEAGLPERGFVFACFNNSYKITPRVFDVWMRLLESIDGSVLWLLDDNPYATANLKREAESRGVFAGRLVFAPRMKFEDHLARHTLADLFLDTLPCNAHTTASDALWMGLPVLTVPGPTFAGRVAASIVSAAGLSELVASSLEAYEAMAVELVRNPEKLARLKDKLVRDRRSVPLFDTARFTRHLEAAFTTMWQRYQRREPPMPFAVPGG